VGDDEVGACELTGARSAAGVWPGPVRETEERADEATTPSGGDEQGAAREGRVRGPRLGLVADRDRGARAVEELAREGEIPGRSVDIPAAEGN